MTHIVVVTGPPASGKTTLGRRLAADLSLPFINKDDIKETLFEALGWKDREWSRRLGITSYRLLYLFVAAQVTVARSLVVESNFDPVIATQEMRKLQARFPFQVIQVLCHADGEVLKRRFMARDESGGRHPGHVDQQAYADVVAVLERGRLDPLALAGPILEVDTTDPAAIDYEAILRQVRDALGCD